MATPQGRPERFLAYSTAGPQRDLARDAREQPRWDEHAAFIDGLVAEGAASWSSWRGTRSRRGNGCGTIRGTRTISSPWSG